VVSTLSRRRIIVDTPQLHRSPFYVSQISKYIRDEGEYWRETIGAGEEWPRGKASNSLET